MPTFPDTAAYPLLFQRTHSFIVPRGQAQHQPLHRHPETVELHLITEGTIECQIDNNLHLVKAGSILLIQPGSWHELKYPAASQQSGYGLSFMRTPSAMPLPETSFPVVIPISHPAQLEALFVQLQTETAQPYEDGTRVAQHVIALLLALVNRSLPSCKPVSRSPADLILEVQHFMEENHCRSLLLEDLAAKFNMDKYQLARLFKQQTGTSPLQYLIACRIGTAKHLLASSKTPVSVIAHTIGYKSVTQFQAAFKHAVGITPREYRMRVPN